MSELHEHKVKRLKMRSMRRGIKEMDIILSHYSDTKIQTMSEQELALYDALLEENDQDLYQWVSGQVPAKTQFSDLILDIVSTMTASHQ